MKKVIVLVCFLSIVLGNAGAQSFRGQSLNGSTGLYSIPSGRIGWEEGGNFGLDTGYRAIINNEAGVAHIPSLTLSLFKWVEISSAFDFQPTVDSDGDSNTRNDDLLLGLKIRLPTNVKNPKNPALAIGANFQLINITNDKDSNRYYAYQPYIAISYLGAFFNMSAETTLVVGKTLYSHGPENNSNIDFGMGFDLVIFPDVFQDAVHWIIDFSNFGYSDNSWPNDGYYHTSSMWRGILNTGFRIDLSTIPALSKMKFLIDLIFNDLFDEGARSFTAGVVIGFSPN